METLRFPLFIDLNKKKVLVVGGGKIAARRVKTLCMYGAEVLVVAPEILEEIRQLPVAIAKRSYFSSDLNNSCLVLAATDDKILNCRITQEARQQGILSNNASDQNDCDFYFPAVALTQALSVGICGTGSDHHAVAEAAAAIRKLMEENS